VKPPAPNEPLPAISGCSRRTIVIAGLLLIAATVIAYSNSFGGPFVFDDIGTILNNPTILHLWPPWPALAGPPGGTTASGRPVVNLSLAFNYALGGFDVRSYHGINLTVHLAAGLTLFGVVRRTLLNGRLRAQFERVALPAAFVCAALWLLHPLQTAAVTYTVQRAESLAGLFYLLTLYGFVRATGSHKPARWLSFSVASCLFGMASKEICVSAPLFVLLYDRTLVSGAFGEAWRRHRCYYLALAGTWLVLAVLILHSGDRDGSIGVAEAITPWSYALTQCRAIIHYLRLTIWPSPLIFDYGTATASSLVDVLPQALLLATLFGATALALWKRSPLGLAGAWFFMILAPSSSVVPVITQTVAEHRMYLPLAAVIVLLVCGALATAGPRSLWIFLGAAALFGGLTFQRNTDYRSAVAIWGDTASKLPESKRAYNNLGTALFNANRVTDALAAYRASVDLDPHYVSARVNLARVQLQNNQTAVAAANFEYVLALDPTNSSAHFGLGYALASTGNLAEGIAHYREACRLQPDATDFRLKLAQALFRAHETTAAIEQFRELIRQVPALAEAHSGLGTVLASKGDLDEASRELAEALRLNPADADAHYNLGNILVEKGRVADAVQHFDAALRINPNHTGARQILIRARAYLQAVP